MSGRIILFRGEVLVHNNSLTQILFIEVPLPNQGSDRLCVCVCVKGINLTSVSTISQLDFGIVLIV